MPRRTAALLLGLWLVAAGPAVASHPKTDIVTLDKGDRFYGEIKKVTQGTLTLKTSSAGTLSVKWSHVTRLVSTFQYQVQVTSRERYYGSLAEPDQEGHLKVVGSAGTHSLPLSDVFWLGPIERGFWRKLTGSVNFGFSYTQSNQAVQYSLTALSAGPGQWPPASRSFLKVVGERTPENSGKDEMTPRGRYVVLRPSFQVRAPSERDSQFPPRE